MPDINTLQSNIKQHTKDMTQYSLFLGGLNVTARALEQYDPLRTGYARIFFVRMPKFMEIILPEKTKKIRHLMEYGFVAIDGIQNTNLDFDPITGGYAGRQFDVPTVAKDDTNEISLRLYECAGSPLREYMDMWISGISDPYTGIGHYHGAMDKDPTIKYSQSNHVAEAIYVQTDPTGREDGIEYACLLSNMMPKNVKKDHFNYESGSHPIVQIDLPFTATKYESPQINIIAKQLIGKYKILRDYLNFNSGYTPEFVNGMPVPEIRDWSE